MVERTFEDREMPDLNGYYCVMANDMARERRAKLRKLARFAQLRQSVIERIMHGWSPQQIAGRLQLERQPSNRRHCEEFRNAALDLIRERYLDAGSREADRAAPDLGGQGNAAAMDDRGRHLGLASRAQEAGFPATRPARLFRGAGSERWIGALTRPDLILQRGKGHDTHGPIN
jgi:hypothetical protein